MRSLTPQQTERLWDAFERVDAVAARIAYGRGYVKVRMQDDLRKALEAYRTVRDQIEQERD